MGGKGRLRRQKVYRGTVKIADGESCDAWTLSEYNALLSVLHVVEDGSGNQTCYVCEVLAVWFDWEEFTWKDQPLQVPPSFGGPVEFHPDAFVRDLVKTHGSAKALVAAIKHDLMTMKTPTTARSRAQQELRQEHLQTL